MNLDDGGYLSDPADEKWGKYFNPDLKPLIDVRDSPCVVLLGEPGMGKSHTLAQLQGELRRELDERSEVSRWVDLRSFQTDRALCRAVFEHPAVVSWASKRGRLNLFLDSLDECLLRIDSVAALLAAELEKCPVDRLTLRIACRTADWPQTLEDTLRTLWGKDGVQVYELAPLRRGDVAAAAAASGLDPEAFGREVARVGVVPLAIKPVTLHLLLNLYKRDARLPKTQRDLYADGCRLMCEETNAGRRDAGRVGRLDADHRFAVAARIAAATVFGNRYAIWTGLDQGDVPPEDVTVADLVGGAERAGEDDFSVDEAAVRDTLRYSGLFSSRGPQRLGWAHQTYAEFLAAHYLIRRGVSTSQIMALLRHPDDADGRLVPQLHEVAGWLAGMSQDVFREVMVSDPDVLLRADVSTVPDADRAALVGTLLRLYEEERLLDSDMNVRMLYRKLAHGGLVEQLRPYIRDRSKGDLVRRVAVDIAEACESRDLLEDLVAVALDVEDGYRTRLNAALAVTLIGDAAAKAKLKPLALGSAGPDPEDELKGCGLRAAWPEHLSAVELFNNLRLPKRRNLHGLYRHFFDEDLLPHLRPEALPPALGWVAAHALPIDSTFKKLIDGIMLTAWEHVDEPGVLEPFAAAAWSRLNRYEELVEGDAAERFQARVTANDDRRRRLIDALVRVAAERGFDLTNLIFARRALIGQSDVTWLLERVESASSSAELRTVWVALVAKGFCWATGGALDAILDTCARVPALAEALGPTFTLVPLESPVAAEQRKLLAERKAWELRRGERPPLLTPPPHELIRTLLAAFEGGDVDAWWQMNMEMTLEPASTHYDDELEWDLRDLPGWKAAAPETRAGIVRTAKAYLLAQDPRTAEWLGTNLIHRPAFAGYRALCLLRHENPAALDELPADVWQRWAPIVLAYPTSSGSEQDEWHHRMVSPAYQHAGRQIIQTVGVLIDKENAGGEHIFVTRKLEFCWDEELDRAVLAKAKDPSLKPTCMGDLLDDVLRRKVPGAMAFAQSLVPVPPPREEPERGRAVIAAKQLLTHADDAGWPVVWPAIQADVAFGKEALSGFAHSLHFQSADVLPRLREDELADLFVFLAKQFPYRAEADDGEGGFVGPLDSVARWRDSVIAFLRDRGTPAACAAISRIISELPELGWLKWTLMHARAQARRHTWRPPRPADVLAIAKDPRARLVENGDQLLELVVESLRRLEAKLHAATPAVVDLWSDLPGGKYRPKDENRFSDYVKRHLDADLLDAGVIVNREVEIRRGEGATPGEETDILVDAVIRGPDGNALDRVSVIVETKGCWHAELKTAMKTQLVDRYLRRNECQHGIYLVGWFNCDHWDRTDSRRDKAPRWTLAQAREFFEGQAAEQSEGSLKITAVVMDTAVR